jgi:hypothetical protein
MFASEEFIGEGTVIDLGVPGCAVESRVTPPPDDYVRLHILMPDEQGPLRVRLAKVRWARHQRFGMEFLLISEDHQVRLGRLLQTHVDALS